MFAIGFNVVKDHAFFAIAEFGEQPQLKKVDRTPYNTDNADGIAVAFDAFKALLRHLKEIYPEAKFSFLASSAGQYGSSIETIKAEGILQLAARHMGVEFHKITPQTLPKKLGLEKGVKWKPHMMSTYNAEKQWKQFGSGGDGAAAAAIAGLR